MMDPQLLTSADVRRSIGELLSTGAAKARWQAEEMFLDQILHDFAQLVMALTDDEVAEHEVIKLLMSHGSGGDQSLSHHMADHGSSMSDQNVC